MHFWSWFNNQTLAAWAQAIGGLLAFGAATWAAIEANRANTRAKEAERDRLSLDLLRDASAALADLHKPGAAMPAAVIGDWPKIDPADRREQDRQNTVRYAALARLNVVAVAHQRGLVDGDLVYAALGPLWSMYGWLPEYIQEQQKDRGQPQLFAPLLELLRHQPPTFLPPGRGRAVARGTGKLTVMPPPDDPPAPPAAPAPPSDGPGSS